MPETIILSDEIVLIYVLRQSGLQGRLTSGRIERCGSGMLNIFDRYGSWLEYFSGDRLRSWCIFGVNGTPMDGWRRVRPEDRSTIPLHL